VDPNDPNPECNGCGKADAAKQSVNNPRAFYLYAVTFLQLTGVVMPMENSTHKTKSPCSLFSGQMHPNSHDGSRQNVSYHSSCLYVPHTSTGALFIHTNRNIQWRSLDRHAQPASGLQHHPCSYNAATHQVALKSHIGRDIR
jgi:hypothetical protein